MTDFLKTILGVILSSLAIAAWFAILWKILID